MTRRHRMPTAGTRSHRPNSSPTSSGVLVQARMDCFVLYPSACGISGLSRLRQRPDAWGYGAPEQLRDQRVSVPEVSHVAGHVGLSLFTSGCVLNHKTISSPAPASPAQPSPDPSVPSHSPSHASVGDPQPMPRKTLNRAGCSNQQRTAFSAIHADSRSSASRERHPLLPPHATEPKPKRGAALDRCRSRCSCVRPWPRVGPAWISIESNSP